jgi:hypothetical protein
VTLFFLFVYSEPVRKATFFSNDNGAYKTAAYQQPIYAQFSALAGTSLKEEGGGISLETSFFIKEFLFFK